MGLFLINTENFYEKSTNLFRILMIKIKLLPFKYQ